MSERISKKVLSWARDPEPQVVEQATRASKLPFVAGYVALMPDAHFGKGAAIGSVIPTIGALVPSAVGVDIGCGMVAAQTDLNASDLVGAETEILERIAQSIPAGLGKWRSPDDRREEARNRLDAAGLLRPNQPDKVPDQLGTLGSGNHFIEICVEENDDQVVWVVLHSGSRGEGNRLAQEHIATAKGLMKDYFIELEDPDLAHLVEGTPEFDAYVTDLLWAQKYALANREWMAELTIQAISEALARPVGQPWTINCHHNYAELEHHHGKEMWVTRKGAIRAREGDFGVIPGSMGTSSFIVSGKGSKASFTSAAHGAGRKMSRSRARKELSLDSFKEAMGNTTWLESEAERLLDEHPDSYKDIHSVMNAQSDLVDPVVELRQAINYKGV